MASNEPEIDTASAGVDSITKDTPVIKTFNRITAAFPGEKASLNVVVKAKDVTAPEVAAGITQLQARAAGISMHWNAQPIAHNPKSAIRSELIRIVVGPIVIDSILTGIFRVKDVGVLSRHGPIYIAGISECEVVPTRWPIRPVDFNASADVDARLRQRNLIRLGRPSCDG